MGTIAASNRVDCNTFPIGFRAEPDWRSLDRRPWKCEPRHLQSGGHDRSKRRGNAVSCRQERSAADDGSPEHDRSSLWILDRLVGR